jgi:YVTN family beta-propeller protein
LAYIQSQSVPASHLYVLDKRKGEENVMSANTFRKCSGVKPLRPLAGLLTAVLSIPALLGQSMPFPTYAVGANKNMSTGPSYQSTLPAPWVLANGQIITPAGTQVYLGITTRAKAVALNPNTKTHTAAVLQMGGPQVISILNTQTGAVMQTYSTPYQSGGKTLTDSSGSHNGIAYTPDGLHLLYSQAGSSNVTVANVDPNTGMITSTGASNAYPTQVALPMAVDGNGNLTTVTCFYNSPPGTTGSDIIPCGQTVSLFGNNTRTSYPMGVAVSSDGKTAYAVLDNNNTLAKIDLTAATPAKSAEIRVGNVPHSVVISADGKTGYVSNEAGRIATPDDFQQYSNGTPVVAAFPTGSTSTGTVSVVDLASFTVTASISTGLHPTGMAIWGNYLLVANAYSDTLSVIDTTNNEVVNTIAVGLPIGVPSESHPAYGAGPNSIAVDVKNNIAYVALYTANAVAVVDLKNSAVQGLIPVGYAPSSVVLDTADNTLLVANDKGLGTTGYGVMPSPNNTAENSYAKIYNVTALNTHQDLGTVSMVLVPKVSDLARMTQQVFQNNHWDLLENVYSAAGGSPSSEPVAIPEKIGAPSKIKHVFVIIRENRTYDQILGDVPGGNGDPSLAVFGNNATFGGVTPNAHALVQRFPLLDNFYDPSRQSADGHNWIVQAMAPYSDDIQSPDWIRDYPSNGGDAIAYQKKGHLWDAAVKAGVSFKNYGEYIEYNTFKTPTGSTTEPLWIDFYNDAMAYESGKESQLYNFNTISSYSPLPNLISNTVQNYPQFDLGIPDQFRVDIWAQDFAKDVANGTVPQLEMMWISSDHTGGPPTAQATQADNDLALGRFIDIISHSPIWSSSVIFVEEDDAQNGVDHVDGHRSPGYVISPYVKQKVNTDGAGAGVTVDSTFYTQVNMTRTIEQILGLKPMNQFDLVASPMKTLFTNDPPTENFLPWTHVPNLIPLNQGVTQTPTQPIPGASDVVPIQLTPNESRSVRNLRAGWMKMKAEIFAGQYHTPDAENPDVVNHLTWYEATRFTRPYPGETKVLPASAFKKAAKLKVDDDDR